jgi:hypothetical protein
VSKVPSAVADLLGPFRGDKAGDAIDHHGTEAADNHDLRRRLLLLKVLQNKVQNGKALHQVDRIPPELRVATGRKLLEKNLISTLELNKELNSILSAVKKIEHAINWIS